MRNRGHLVDSPANLLADDTKTCSSKQRLFRIHRATRQLDHAAKADWVLNHVPVPFSGAYSWVTQGVLFRCHRSLEVIDILLQLPDPWHAPSAWESGNQHVPQSPVVMCQDLQDQEQSLVLDVPTERFTHHAGWDGCCFCGELAHSRNSPQASHAETVDFGARTNSDRRPDINRPPETCRVRRQALSMFTRPGYWPCTSTSPRKTAFRASHWTRPTI